MGSVSWLMILVVLVVIPIVAGLVFVFMLIRMLLRRRDESQLGRAEQENLEHMSQLLEKMDRRISNLETLLGQGGHRDNPDNWNERGSGQ